MRRVPGITEPFCQEDDRVRLGRLRLLRNFHREQASITARKLSALTRKQTPSPTAATRKPATDGPMIRAALKAEELRPMADGRSARGTRSAMKD